MCNRYRVTAARAAVAARFGVTLIPDADTLPPPELFPKRPAWVVRRVGDQRQLEVMQWGVPFNGVSISWRPAFREELRQQRKRQALQRDSSRAEQ
jgi:putative SOS response-associated peptidase YedK